MKVSEVEERVNSDVAFAVVGGSLDRSDSLMFVLARSIGQRGPKNRQRFVNYSADV